MKNVPSFKLASFISMNMEYLMKKLAQLYGLRTMWCLRLRTCAL